MSAFPRFFVHTEGFSDCDVVKCHEDYGATILTAGKPDGFNDCLNISEALDHVKTGVWREITAEEAKAILEGGK